MTRKRTAGTEEMREREKSRKREIRVDVRREDAAVWESCGQQLASRPLPSSWSLCAWQHGGNKHSLSSCILLQAVCDPVNADRCIPPSALHDSMCARLEEVKLSYWAHLVQLSSKTTILTADNYSAVCKWLWTIVSAKCTMEKNTSRRNKHQAWCIFRLTLFFFERASFESSLVKYDWLHVSAFCVSVVRAVCQTVGMH